MRNEIKLDTLIEFPLNIVNDKVLTATSKVILCILLNQSAKDEKLDFSNHAFAFVLGTQKEVVSRNLKMLQDLVYIKLNGAKQNRVITITDKTREVAKNGCKIWGRVKRFTTWIDEII